MSNRVIDDALTNIDSKYIDETIEMIGRKKSKVLRFPNRISKMIAGLAVVIFALGIGTVSAVAAGNTMAYNLLYAVYPEMAMSLTPVQDSCVDQGIEMCVEGINIDGAKADIYVSLKDLEGDRIDETVDLFDSYGIDKGGDQTAGCSFVGYDATTKMATFLIEIQNMDDQPIDGEKITFSVTDLLLKKNIFTTDIDFRNKVELVDEVRYESRDWLDGSQKEESFLVTNPDKAYKISDQVAVCGYGFVEDKLHVQVAYSDIWEYDNHGFIELINGGEVIPVEYMDSYDQLDKENNMRYYEYIFDMSEEELANASDLKMVGEFTTCNTNLHGDWSVSCIIK